MKHKIIPLETVNALVTEPSTAFGIETRPEVAILCLKTRSGDWSMELDTVVSSCIVLGFKGIILDLRDSDISSSFQVACIVSAWHLLIDVGGTLLLCGLSENSHRKLQDLSESKLFNIFEDLDEGIDWLNSAFGNELKRSFPRLAKCTECGKEGKVFKRGDHVCDGCGMTYLVTERGELLF